MYTLVSSEQLVGSHRATFDDSVGSEIIVDIPTQFIGSFIQGRHYDIYFDTTQPGVNERLRLIMHGVIYSAHDDTVLLSFGGFLAKITSESVGVSGVYTVSKNLYMSVYESE